MNALLSLEIITKQDSVHLGVCTILATTSPTEALSLVEPSNAMRCRILETLLSIYRTMIYFFSNANHFLFSWPLAVLSWVRAPFKFQ